LFDELVKSQKMTSPVIPAKAGIQEKQALLDPGFRRGDGFWDFLRDHLVWVIRILVIENCPSTWLRVVSPSTLLRTLAPEGLVEPFRASACPGVT
jgi:hypothetical protein